jgi:hypothetical protein
MASCAVGFKLRWALLIGGRKVGWRVYARMEDTATGIEGALGDFRGGLGV